MLNLPDGAGGISYKKSSSKLVTLTNSKFIFIPSIVEVNGTIGRLAVGMFNAYSLVVTLSKSALLPGLPIR